MIINAYCQSRGWLFDDLKAGFKALGAVVSDEPVKTADAWICIRTREAVDSPDPLRTVVQVHDLDQREAVERKEWGVVSFVHPAQERDWYARGYAFGSVVCPIGARASIQPSALPHRPTIGWFGREVAGAKRSDLFARAVDLARKQVTFDVLMIGERLRHIARLGKLEERAAGVDDYARIDALCVTSQSPMVPLSMYEAAAAGKAVISTPRELPGGLDTWSGLTIADTAQAMAAQIVAAVRQRRTHEPCVPYTREAWAQNQMNLAAEIAHVMSSIGE